MQREFPFAPALLLLAIIVVAAGCSPAKRDYNRAQDLLEKFRSGDRNVDYLKQAQADLRQAVQEDPSFADAYRSLGNVDEVLHSPETARDYETASMLDPSDQRLLAKARFYHHLAQLSLDAGNALDEIKAGDDPQGFEDLKTALKEARDGSQQTTDHIVQDARQAAALIVQHGDKEAADERYIDAVRTYDLAIQGYMLIAQATNAPTLDLGANDVMRKANKAADQAGAPQMTANMLNEVLTVDPNNQTANMELAQVYLRKTPPDYRTAADLEERAGASDAQVKKLRAEAKRRH